MKRDMLTGSHGGFRGERAERPPELLFLVGKRWWAMESRSLQRDNSGASKITCSTLFFGSG